MKTYTVFAIDTNDMHRRSFVVEDHNPARAEDLIHIKNPGLWVAGVIEGSHPTVDSRKYGDEKFC